MQKDASFLHDVSVKNPSGVAEGDLLHWERKVITNKSGGENCKIYEFAKNIKGLLSNLLIESGPARVWTCAVNVKRRE